MIDYRAIEEAEATLDQKIAEATDPVKIASGTLKRGILRPWAIWIAQNADRPSIVRKAGARIIGDLIVELAINAHAERSDGRRITSPEYAADLIVLILQRVQEGIAWDEAGRKEGSMTLVEMNMNGVQTDG